MKRQQHKRAAEHLLAVAEAGSIAFAEHMDDTTDPVDKMITIHTIQLVIARANAHALLANVPDPIDEPLDETTEDELRDWFNDEDS